MATILLVDDDTLVLNFCARVLQGIEGLEVLKADGSGQAIRVASEYPGPIPLLLSDISMPGAMTGLELAQNLTAFRPDMKVVLMSGQVRESADFKPGWQFLKKPFLPGTLVAAVANAGALGTSVHR